MTATPSEANVPSRAQRFAVLVLQAGALACVVAVSIRRGFELDRFLVPKELVLHLTALLALLFAFNAARKAIGGRADLLLSLFLALSALSAIFATNRWLGLRGLAVTASGIAIYWVARALDDRRVLVGLAVAVTAAAITSLMQAYGVHLDVFAENRSPGGTLGNRNFVAHAAAFGLPLCLYVAMTARRFAIAAASISVITAALVLTRSRAAWLATGAMLLIFIAAIFIAPSLRRSAATWKRFLALLVAAVIGTAAALLIPNSLEWRSDNPYLESLTGVANYEGGSGRGRLVQYGRSLAMTVYHPVLGVGPGNWPVVYPRHAARNDPSLDDSQGGMTVNPWPSSDWIAYVSERGPVAAATLGLAFVSIVAAAFRSLRSAVEPYDALRSVALIATVAAALIAGAFDAVLLLGLPTLIVWAAIGSLAPPVAAVTPSRLSLVPVALLVVALAGAFRSTMQIVAMEAFATGGRAELERASALDPGNYRVHMRLANRCEHARAAAALFPTSQAARNAARKCR